MSSPLREARSLRGWTATQLQAKLRAEAAKRGLVLPDASSLRVMISKWENGHRAPDLMYQALLQAVYDLPPEALGFTAEDAANGANEVVLPALTRRMGVRALEEPAFHDYFTAQLASHARADNLMGPTLVVGTAQAQALELERLVTRSDRAVVPPESFALAAHFNELAGWLLQDGGQFAKALETTNKAVDLAKVGEDHAIAAYCLMRKSNVLHSLGQMRAALAVATEAVDLANAGAPELLPVCYRQQALAAAGCARRDEAQRFLDNALSAAEAQRPSSLDEYCTTPYVQMEAARCWISLDQPARAVEISRQALGHWPAELVRDKSLCAAHLALALTMSSEVDDACQAALDAVLLIESAPSARAIQAVRQAASNLAPFRQSKRVRDTIREIARVA